MRIASSGVGPRPVGRVYATWVFVPWLWFEDPSGSVINLYSHLPGRAHPVWLSSTPGSNCPNRPLFPVTACSAGPMMTFITL